MERVGAMLRNLEGGEPLRRRLAEARALECWPDLVGTHLAKRTRPLRVEGKRLLVVAHGSALRQELTFHKETILRKFNELAGGARVREILFFESDENLSTLDGRDEPTPARGEEGTPREEQNEVDRDPAYARFDAEAYREELRRLENE